MERGNLVDRIYEAAFLPERWPAVLKQVGQTAQSVSGTLLVLEDFRPVRCSATPLIAPWVERFCSEAWKTSRRPLCIRQRPPAGFTVWNRYFGPEIMARDASHIHRLSLGLDSEIGTAIPMPTGEVVVFSFDRRRSEGPHDHANVAALNRLRPHLARAGLIAARLALERAVATTSALRTIGLPAAVLSVSGRVIATNELFEDLQGLFRPAAFGRMAIAGTGANRLLQPAIEAAADEAEPKVSSVPVAWTEEHPACVLHILPLRRDARDLFGGGATVLAVSVPRKSGPAPSADILAGLFDLTPAEARFAQALAAGHSLKAAAKRLHLAESSGRTYLARIFAKTGTHRQAELVSLLGTAHPFRREMP